MTRPQTVLRSVKEAIKDSGRMPTEMTYATFEMDEDGGQSNVRPPALEITTQDAIRVNAHNTDLVGHSTNDSGEQIGYIYRTSFEMPVQVDVITAEGGGFDPDVIGYDVRKALRRYDNHQHAETLPDPDDTSTTLSEATHFYLGDGRPENDLTMTPALRRWRQECEVWFYDEIDTAEEYEAETPIRTVVGPEDGSFEDGTSIGAIFDATPSTDSPADNY